MSCSQSGNNMFPGWEQVFCYVIAKRQSEIRQEYFGIRQEYFEITQEYFQIIQEYFQIRQGYENYHSCRGKVEVKLHLNR